MIGYQEQCGPQLEPRQVLGEKPGSHLRLAGSAAAGGRGRDDDVEKSPNHDAD
jgi:hypothetical protein